MFDMKYHIASLVAVFLALTVGIVLGTAIVNRGVLVQQQTALVRGLRTEFAGLRDRNRALQDQANADAGFFKSAVPVIVDKKLAGRKVTVVSTDTNDSVILRQTVSNLKQAGASVNVVTILRSDLGMKNKAMAQKLGKVFVREKLSGEALKDRLIAELATQITTRTEPAFLRQLAEIGIIQVSRTDALPAGEVVLLAGSGKQDMIEGVQIPLIGQMKKSKATLVGGEASGITESVVGAYQKAEISTVDNMNSPIGQVSMVMVLAGSPGHYGTKNTADELTPKLGAR